jgi:tRNA-2-methylthio-N6-dimethylallyladenosine synthase
MKKNSGIKTFHIQTFGCQMNLADSSTLAATMLTRGYQRVSDEDKADLLILNTCSVREKAEQRVHGRLGEMKRFKSQKPHLKVAVVGCMAQRIGEGLASESSVVDYVLGTDRLFELPDVIEGREGVSEVMTAFGHETLDQIQPVMETEYSGFVTITRGCNNYCAYCIVPYVRGKEVCHSANYVVDAVKKMVDKGAREVMLLGQNVNSYRSEGLDFAGLLYRVARESGVERMRFMTSHPKDLSRGVVDAIAEIPQMMGHLHLPLQSGSDRILKKMGRIYTLERYLGIVDYVREKLPDISLTTDLIVGFPSETEREYEATLDAVRQIRFDNAFMFRYSIRPGTVAAKFDDDVPEEDKIRRLNRLIELQQKIGFKVNQNEVGHIRMSLVEGRSRRSGDVWRARTEGSKTVLFKSDKATVGDIVPVRISEADAFTLHGTEASVN